ncbi:MMPL family transporter [Aquimarina sp. AU119]|uniref:MMPL family transporter n=1 Tax=Aquimarina sp. AU119 TaxID=2108528 RepID=UPI000D68B987|nr:MMPL family transporter [Aquimarina sp. AU119]
MGNLFWKIYRSIAHKRIYYGIISIVLMGILSWIASGIKFDEDISKLIPANKENEKLQKVLKNVNFSDKIIVNISLEDNGEFEDLVDYAIAFTDSISNNYNKYITSIKGKIEEEDALETIDFVYNNLPFFLSESDYETIASKIDKDSIETITKANYETLVSPSGFIAKSFIVKDPLGVSFMGLKQLNELGLADDFKLKDGFLVHKDEKHILLFISPKFDTGNTAENQPFSDTIYRLQKDLNSDYKNKVRSTYFGGPLIAVANAEQIKTDIQFTVSIALSILLLLFIFFYKKLSIPLILFVPTIFGALLAIAILSLIRTEISAISLGIGAVLLGVTIDYSLHILTHIRSHGTTKSLYTSISKPIIMSSLTTALAFLCLLFIESQALQDLGIFAAISVIGSSVFALIFIPQTYKPKASGNNIKSTFIDTIANYNFNKNKTLIAVLCILLVLSLFTFNKVVFNKDLSQLNYTSPELDNAELQLDNLINISSKSLYIVAFGNTMEAVLQTNDNMHRRLSKFKSEDAVLDFNSIGALVSSSKRQNKQIQDWEDFWGNNKKIKLKEYLIESGNAFGFKSTSFNEFYELLDKKFNSLKIVDYSKITSIPIDDFISVNDDFITVTSIVKINKDQISLVKDAFNSDENIIVFDRQNVNEELLGGLKNEFNNLIGYSFTLIVLLLLTFYKNIKLTLITILPILATWLLTLGLMGLFGLEFNIFSIIISTFIFGLGVDYSIFMTNGLLRQSQYDIKTLATFKASVILSVITTLLGVGVLIFAKHPALSSLALVSVIGIISAMLISFTIQPFLYKFFIRNSTKEMTNEEN